MKIEDIPEYQQFEYEEKCDNCGVITTVRTQDQDGQESVRFLFKPDTERYSAKFVYKPPSASEIPLECKSILQDSWKV